MARFTPWLSAVVPLCGLWLAQACGGGGSPLGVRGVPSVDSLQDGGASDAGPCIDLDGDGFGSGCGVADCDDGDPESTDECIACYDEKEGCLCTPGTAPLFCKPGLVQIGERTVLCNEGARYCRDGVWTECEPSLGG